MPNARHLLLRLRGGQVHGKHQQRRGQEGESVGGEQCIVAHQKERTDSENRAQEILEIISEPRQGQRARVLRFIREHVRDRRLKCRSEARRAAIQQEDHEVDLPDFGDEGQADDEPCTRGIERDEKSPAG